MRVLPVVLIATLAAAAGCERDTPAVTPPASQPASTDATGAGTTASDTHTVADEVASPAPVPPPAPGVSLALVAAVDEHEIAVVEQGRDRKLGAAVREYAQMLEREHRENLAQSRELKVEGKPIEPETTTEVHALIGKNKAALDALANTPAADYEHAWLQAMVDGHTEALAMLDTRLIPAATDDSLRNFLNNTRDHMAMHLERGRALLDASKAR